MNGSDAAVSRAFRTGAAIGLLFFLLVLTGARPTLFSWAPAGDFYDAQADSFLEGRLDIDADRLGIEGFTHDGATYMYQPPFPALLRLPVAAWTDSYDGRLGQVSMLLALLVGLSATRRILVEARRSLRSDADVTSLERAAGFGLGLVVAGGSVPVFLASRAWVYHESALWGMSWTLMAIAALLAHRRDPSWSTLVATGACTLAAVGSRASVGAGACAAIGLVAVLAVFTGRDQPLRSRLLGPAGAVALLVAAAIPAIAYASLNVAKFDSPTSIPFEDQAFTKLSPARQAMLDENGGTLFGLQFAPTTMVHYLRPVGGLDVTHRFPFVDFPSSGEPVIGDVTFDLVDRTASIPQSLAALAIPALVGLWALGRRGTPDRLVWGAVAAGASVGSMTIIPFGYVAHRYLADVMPVLVVLTTVGLQHGLGALDRREAPVGAPVRIVPWAAIAVLVPVAVVVNVGLATMYQRLYAPSPSPDAVAGLLDARAAIGSHPDVITGEALPTSAEPHDVAVVGDCSAVYVWDGSPVGEFRADAWVAAERTEAAGHVQATLEVDDLDPRTRHPLVVAPSAGPTVAWVERLDDGALRAGLSGPGGDVVGRAVQPSGRSSIDVVLDPFTGEATVRLGDEEMTSGVIERGSDVHGLVVGGSGGITGFAPSTPLTSAAEGQRGDDGSLCRDLIGR